MDRRQLLRSAATRGFVVMVLAFLLGSLLNAQGLRKTAQIQPDGLRRDLALAVTLPLVRVSHFLYLDRPRQELKAAIGRGDDDRVDTRIALPPLGPPARPKPRKPVTPKPHKPKPHKPKTAPKPAFSPTRPLEVWFAGDSLAQVPGESLERATAGTSAISVLPIESRVATGLGRPDVYNWYTRFQEVISQLKPHAAVLSLGSNDPHDYLAGVPPGRTIGKMGSPSWVAEYRRRVAGVTRAFNAAGAYVLWVGLPITRGEGRNRGFRVVNRIMRQVAAKYPKTAFYLDTWAMFLDRRGRYADYLPNKHGQLILMRGADGVHFTPAAGDLVARAVLHQLNSVYDLTSWKRKPPRAT